LKKDGLKPSQTIYFNILGFYLKSSLSQGLELYDRIKSEIPASYKFDLLIIHHLIENEKYDLAKLALNKYFDNFGYNCSGIISEGFV
jgi:hypothetical protein